MQCHASARLVPRMMVKMGGNDGTRATVEQGRGNAGGCARHVEGAAPGDRTRPCAVVHPTVCPLQAGYLECQPETEGSAPLHCVVRVVPAQVRSELGTLHRCECECLPQPTNRK